MSCIKFHEMISKLVDGELSEPAREQLISHLSQCRDCTTFYERVETLDDNLQTIESVLPNTALPVRVKDRIADLRRGNGHRPWFPSWVQVPLMAVIVLCALGVGNLAGKSLGQMLTSDRYQNGIELLVTETGQSFSDVVLDIGTEGNSR